VEVVVELQLDLLTLKRLLPALLELVGLVERQAIVVDLHF
jgi:hypothetical protein